MNDTVNKTFTDTDALLSLAGNIPWKLTGENVVWVTTKEGNEIPENLEWYDSSYPIPTKLELANEVVRLQAEWDEKQYQRQRQPEYPPLADLADALYWQAQGDESKMQEYLSAVQSVKNKYPKGEPQ
jgi:hypothetical protein